VTDPAVPDPRSLATNLAITLANHVKEFLGIVALSPQYPLRTTKRLRATVGYKIVFSYTTPGNVEIEARCNSGHALALLVDHLKEYDATIEAVSRHILRATIVLSETAPSEPDA